MKMKIFVIIVFMFFPIIALSQEKNKIAFPDSECRKSFTSAIDFSMAVAIAFVRQDGDCLNYLLHHRKSGLSDSFPITKDFNNINDLRMRNNKWRQVIISKMNELSNQKYEPLINDPIAIVINTRELTKIKVPLKNGIEEVPFEEKIGVSLFYKNSVFTVEMSDIALIPNFGWASCSPQSFIVRHVNINGEDYLKKHEEMIGKMKNQYVLRKAQ